MGEIGQAMVGLIKDAERAEEHLPVHWCVYAESDALLVLDEG